MDWVTLINHNSIVLKTIKSLLKLIIFLGLGLFLVWYSTKDLSSTDVERVKSLVYESNWLMVVPCMLILIFSHFIRALRWRSMIMTIGGKPKALNVFLAVIIGFFFNLIFPRLGEVMKCTLLGKYEKLPVDKMIGTMVAERLVDMLCLILVIAVTIFSQLELVSSYTVELLLLLKGKLNNSSYIIIISILLLVSLTFIILYINRIGYSGKWIKAFKSAINGFYEGLISVRNLHNKKLFFIYTFTIWFLYLLSIKVGFYAISEISNLGWTPSITILTFGSFAMIATQGGIGAYQLAVQKTLTIYGIKPVIGLAFGWLMWSVQTLMLVIIGPISLFLLYSMSKKGNIIRE